MYCRNCGKQIDYDSDLCLECKAEQAAKAAYLEVMQRGTEQACTPAPVVAAQPREEEKPSVNPRMIGFGKALASTIVGFIAFIYAYVAYVVSIIVAEPDFGAPFLVFGLLFLGVGIPFMITGIQSIKAAKSRKNNGHPLPIAPFILGISGTALNGFVLFLSTVMILIALATL